MVGVRSWKLLVLLVATGGVLAWTLRARGRDSSSAADRTVTTSARVAEQADVVASSDVTDGSDAPHADRETAPAAGGESTAAARAFSAPAPEVDADPRDTTLDLARIEHDLAGVEAALRRLDDGTYWTDEITGDPLDDGLLLADPVARRNR